MARIEKRFVERIVDQSKYLEGDLSKYIFSYGLRRGMTVLELGSCLGIHASEIAKAIFPGVLISLDDRHEHLLYQKEHSEGNLLLVQGKAESLPLKTESFDFAYCRFLFQHLRVPQKALSQIHRALKKKGILLIVDTDDYHDVYFPHHPLVKKAYTALAKLQHLQEGGDRFIGRKLFYYMVGAGFRNVGVKVVSTIQHGKSNKELITRDIVPMFKEEYENIINRGLMAKEELAQAISAMLKSANRKDSFYIGLIFIVYGHK